MHIEYIGKIDHQVKIRGFRIELGEIEAALSQHPQVLSVVIIVREDIPGDKRLVAYLVLNQQLNPPITEWRQFLHQKLPDYMIPSAFVYLDSLPLTPNGKIDRRNLPAPESHQQLKASFVPPRNSVEEILVGIWSNVLGVQQVGIYDNFFTLGGHSLLATQLVSRVRRTFKVELPLRSLFEASTVAELAECIHGLQQDFPRLSVPSMQAIARNGQLPLSFAQQRLWFLAQLEPNSPFYNMPGVIKFQGQLNLTALEQSLSEIIRRHEILRTNFIVQDGQAVQIIHPAHSWTLPVIDWRHLPISEQEISTQQLAKQEAQWPFDLAQEALVRATVLVLSDTEHIFLFTMHHIVFDGWSTGILVKELTVLYSAFCNGQPSPLPELTIQYADFAVWQREWLQGEALQTQLAYWQQQLANLPILKLPIDRPQATPQTLTGTQQSLVLSKALSKNLKALSHQEEVTLFMTLLAAFKLLLYYCAVQDDIVVGTDVANRNRIETEQLIGFFVNQLVLRTNLSGNPTFRELLERVRHVTLDAYAHQDVPFDKLVADLNPDRNLSHTPLFQAKFVFQNAPMSDLELSNLTLSVSEVDTETTKFDLLLTMWDTDEGLAGSVQYSTNLFNADTIARMLENFQMILDTTITQPDMRLNSLVERLAEVDKQKRAVKQTEFKQTKRSKFRSVKPQLINKAID